MTNEELQILLPLAAKACGLNPELVEFRNSRVGNFKLVEHKKSFAIKAADGGKWNPLESLEQCAEMNAALEHNTHWSEKVVWVGYGNTSSSAEHNGTAADRLRAWMEVSVRAAAKVGEKK